MENGSFIREPTTGEIIPCRILGIVGGEQVRGYQDILRVQLNDGETVDVSRLCVVG